MCCIVLHCIASHCITLYCIVLYHCIALYCIALHCIVWYCIVLHSSRQHTAEHSSLYIPTQDINLLAFTITRYNSKRERSVHYLIEYFNNMATGKVKDSEIEVKPPGSEGKWWFLNPLARKSLRQTLQDMTLHGVHQVAEEGRLLWSRSVYIPSPAVL